MSVCFVCSCSLGLASEPVTLSIWWPPHYTDPVAEENFFIELNNKFEKENPGVKVEMMVIPWDGLLQKYVAAVESKKLPDLLASGPTQLMALVPSGMIRPATDLAREIREDIRKRGEDDSFTTSLVYYQWEGETWGIPLHTVGFILFYNKKHFLEAGLDPDKPPTNWDEFLEYAKKLTREGRYGFSGLYSRDYLTAQHLLTFSSQAGGGLRKDGKVILDSKENAVAFQFYADLYLKHKVVPPAALSQNEMMTYDDFSSGRTSMGIFLPQYATAWKSQLPPERFSEFGYATLPEGPKGKLSWGCSNPIYMSATSKHVDIAKKWIKFWLRDDNMHEWLSMTGRLSPLKYQNKKWMSEYEHPWTILAADQSRYFIDWGYPEGGSPAGGIVGASFIYADILQEVVFNNRPVEEVLAEYQKEVEEMYSKY